MINHNFLHLQRFWINMMSVFDPPQSDSVPEDNLITIFRIASIGRVILSIVILVITPESPDADLFRIIIISESTLLFFYLSSPYLGKKLQHRYIPIALAWSTLMPILASNITIFITFDTSRLIPFIERFPMINNIILLSSIGQTLPMLLIPLIIISWQYSRRSLLIFCLGMSLLDLGLIILFSPVEGLSLVVAFALIAFRAIVFVMVGLIVNHLVTLQKRQEQSLREANARLRDYAITREHLIASQERNRLAREMHDTLAHALAASTVQLEAVQVIWDSQPERAKELVQQSSVTMRNGLRDTRRALQALRAESLESVGFIGSLHQLAEDVQKRQALSVSIDSPNDLVWLTKEQEHILYRITQESLSNITRHAQAKHAKITLTSDGDSLQLTIHDDGIGFNQEIVDKTAHFGLEGMRERAMIIGAKLTVDSKVGSSTTIHMQFKRNDHAHSRL